MPAAPSATVIGLGLGLGVRVRGARRGFCDGNSVRVRVRG